MNVVFGAFLVLVLPAQTQGLTFDGAVVDEQGKPVAGAAVIFQESDAPLAPAGSAGPRTETDAAGRFRLVVPAPRRRDVSTLWVFRPGLALAGVSRRSGLPASITLTKPKSRPIMIEGPDGKPVTGAKVWPESILFASLNGWPSVPDALASSLAVTTAADGKAALDYLAASDSLVRVFVEAESIGTQVLQFDERPARAAPQPSIAIRLKPVSRLAGRVKTRSGEPVAGQIVEIWSQVNKWGLASQVRFKSGPIRTNPDGSFQTPDNLLVGTAYRAVVRAPGMEPVLSAWITIGATPRVMLRFVLRPLGTISGRAVDRQGRPVAGINVFQSGDGPERTSVFTDALGRFTLGGFCQGPVFLFARGESYRFFGRLIKAAERDGDVALELTRLTERPVREMRMLPDPIPLEESRALARRLIEPYWKGFGELSNADKVSALPALVRVDPIGVLQKLDAVKFPSPMRKGAILTRLVRALAQIDAAEAETVAEAIDEPIFRARALVAVAHALPDRERARKLALLERALVQARSAGAANMRVALLSVVAAKWHELGEKEKAKVLFAEALRLTTQATAKGATIRSIIAPRLACVDLPSALAFAEEFRASDPRLANQVLPEIASRVAADNPAEAERVLSLVPSEGIRNYSQPAVAWKIATADPARAWRMTESAQQMVDYPERYLFLAHGLKDRDPAGAARAFQIAMQGIDRLMTERPYRAVLSARQVLLPMVEQLDPALVPEYFWRIVATRPPVGDPGDTGDFTSAELALLLGWYDRDVAEILLESARVALEKTNDKSAQDRLTQFLAWSIIDPRSAVARLEQVPIDPNLDLNEDDTRQWVCEVLQLPRAARWRYVFLNRTELALILEDQEY